MHPADLPLTHSEAILFDLPPMRLPEPCRPEAEVVADRLRCLHGALEWPAAAASARPWVQAVRDEPPPFWAMESLLREFPISSAEGLALMRLAEALLRVPDAQTAIALTADQLGRADFSADDTGTGSPFARLSASAIALSRVVLPGDAERAGLMSRLGARTVVAATVRAVQLLGRQFVLGQDIADAQAQACDARRSQPALRFSFDMLGEGARSADDARRYHAAYAQAIEAIAAQASATGVRGAQAGDGISIKLSALHPRYEAAQRQRVMDELVPAVWTLVAQAARADINLTIDAEEVDRLELSLEVFEALARRAAREFPRWSGFGLALQAYQTRALELVRHVIALARELGVRFMCRLVKGAYWDSEIKRAQELGLPHYPVFTHKHHTDISYLACAWTMLQAPDAVFAQFASHNAVTIAAIRQLARRAEACTEADRPVPAGPRYELQRLHGMGEGVYREVLRDPTVACRVYAPVGRHRDLLAYLVRRLLENGANSSFVHQLNDPAVDVDALLASPLHLDSASGVPLPEAMFAASGRRNSAGLDLAVPAQVAPLARAWSAVRLPQVAEADAAALAQDRDPALAALLGARSAWADTPVEQRAQAMERAADRLQAELPQWCALLVAEGRKTWGDAVAEVREAIDFLRYYAIEARRVQAPQALPGPTGESNELRLRARGLWVCISPWNFPLAIFLGQVSAALVTGNVVAAKPAEQTPAVAAAAVALLHECGVPRDALALFHGAGDTVGAALVAHPQVAGVAFTGSTQVARLIARSLAAKDGPLVPLIAETGGLNAMLVDSTALPEQVVDAVVQSAFRSAGQRCSALRLLLVHEAVAEPVIDMLRGAMAELRAGAPAALATDLGPLIDAEAAAHIGAHVQRLRAQATVLAEGPAPAAGAALRELQAPLLVELPQIGALRQEVFGPVLHLVRWGGDPRAVIDQVNALGYGLTLGIQTRIDSRAQALAARARVGNVYINRNTIGAVVGVQPFGGEGLSGTGPKAGGPHYLPRFCVEQTVTVNTAAAGGNVALLA